MINYFARCEGMLEEPERILETMRRRELDIQILELQLKHGLTKKRAESKLLIMYYKACNVVSRAKLMMHGINSHDVKAPDPPGSPDQIDPWNDHQKKRI